MLLIDPVYLWEMKLCEDCRRRIKLEPVLTPADILPKKRIRTFCPRCKENLEKNWFWWSIM